MNDWGELRNTRSMDLRPESPPDFSMLDRQGSVGLLVVLTGEAFLKMVAYPVVVENWRKKDCGRGKRAWLATFSAAERCKISRFDGRFYR